MRAYEFIIENKGTITKRHQSATRGLNVFADSNYDRMYDLNRVMMAAAATDGSFVPDIDSETWYGKNNTAHPYTREEQNMMKQAYRAAGVKSHDMNHGDLESQEPPGGNSKSPIKAFKGYPR